MSFSEKVLQLKQDFDDVFEAGKKEIWKGITCNGTRVHYANAFAYQDLDYFYPCYDMQPTNASYMFTQTRNNGQLDLVDRLAKCGVTLDFSKSTNMQRTFYVSGMTRIGVIDCSSASGLDYLVCSSLYLHTIEKMIVHKGNTYTSSFDAASALEEIRFEGEIGNNINFSACTKLSHDSLINDEGNGAINVLTKLESGVTRTLSLGTTNLAKLTEDEKDVARQKGWTLE